MPPALRVSSPWTGPYNVDRSDGRIGLNQRTTAGTTALGDDGREISFGIGNQSMFREWYDFKTDQGQALPSRERYGSRRVWMRSNILT
jgi:hypothetical protein